MRFTKTLTLLCLGLGTAALAHGGVKNQAVMERMTLMTDIKEAMAVLGNMAKGKTPHDAAQAEKARNALAKHAAQIPELFETPASDPKSEARPDIWLDWPDFMAKAGAMEEAAKALDPTNLEALRAGMGALGGSCSGCHKPYRIEK
ncbi:cytochrome c [uncultured Pelagimonas sp.]|uniref:c-type cytochrome n=1 Tax=uncultured Pelagimonas sp. TaxID=1618102 RepID=UPI002606B8C2|nr:cytochrome c [uncultured Pelagimonas sp.]